MKKKFVKIGITFDPDKESHMRVYRLLEAHKGGIADFLCEALEDYKEAPKMDLNTIVGGLASKQDIIDIFEELATIQRLIKSSKTTSNDEQEPVDCGDSDSELDIYDLLF